MKLRYNDEWHAEFTPPTPGRYRYTVLGLGRRLRIVAPRADAPRRCRRHPPRRPRRRAGDRRGRRARRRRRPRGAGAMGPRARARRRRHRHGGEPSSRRWRSTRASPRPRPRHPGPPARRRTSPRNCRWSPTASVRASAPGTSSSRARPCDDAGRARHLPRRRGAPAADRGHGLRRAVLPADPSDRPRAAQGPQQRARRPSPAMSAARGPSARPRAATRTSCPSSARPRTSATWSHGGRRPGHRHRDGHRLPVRARTIPT